MSNSDKTINIPNILTLARILMTPLFVILLLKKLFGVALLVFLLAGISDALDGAIARCFNQRTALGAYLDPIADKLLLMAAYISLAVLKMMPAWVTVIVITRDIIIMLGIAVLFLTEIHVRMAPSILSKCTTALQLATVALTLFSWQFSKLHTFVPALYWLTAVLTTLSGLHYIYVGMNILQSATNNGERER